LLKETQTKLKLTWWPTPQDYNEAIQITRGNLQDPQLQQGLVYTDAIGLPRPITGSFACVYRLHCPESDFALRLFLRNIKDQEERYALISHFVQHDDLPYTVTFDFLKSGIKVMGEWLPALKMEWVDGHSLDDYIVENLANPAKLGRLADKFVTMMDDLDHAGIAHGDLQHGNIIVWRDELRLVDYDGMFVPAMHGFEASELGHRNYQHPARAAKHFGAYLDNFSAWVIYASIKGLQIDSRLLHQLGGGDDCLLFRQTDFLNPLQSHAFAAFEKHPNKELNALGRFLRQQLKNDPAMVPALKLPVPAVEYAQLESLSPALPIVRAGARLIRGNLPDWLKQENATALSEGNSPAPSHATSNAATGGAATKPSAHQSWTVPVKQAPAVRWIQPAAVPTIPPELLTGPKRQVRFYEASGYMRPLQLQLLVIILSLLFCFCFLSVNGVMPILLSAVAAVAAASKWIWVSAWRHRTLAQSGIAVLARVNECLPRSLNSLSKGEVWLSYYHNKEVIRARVFLSSSDFATVKPGSVEVVLYDKAQPWRPVLYRYCRYHALPNAPPTLPGSTEAWAARHLPKP